MTETIVCEQCGATVERRANGSKRDFCSRECFREALGGCWRDKDWFVEHYVERRTPVSEMMRIADCSKGTINNWRVRHGIPIREAYPTKTLTCQQCGMERQFSVSDDVSDPYFCSRECYDAHAAENAPIPDRTCEHCGATYSPRIDEQRFCCQGCLREAWRGMTIIGNCYQCGARVAKPAYSLTSERMFCNWDCYADYRKAAKILTGAEHPMYKGGFDWRRHDWDKTDEAKAWRGAVIERDGSCQLCGAEESLVVHHIEDTRTAPEKRADVDNGVLLCRTCHGKVHFDGNDYREDLQRAVGQ